MLVRVEMINDWKEFETIVRQCSGDIILHTKDDGTVNLTKDIAVFKIEEEVSANPHGADLELTEAEDFISFMRFLMETSRPVRKNVPEKHNQSVWEYIKNIFRLRRQKVAF